MGGRAAETPAVWAFLLQQGIGRVAVDLLLVYTNELGLVLKFDHVASNDQPCESVILARYLPNLIASHLVCRLIHLALNPILRINRFTTLIVSGMSLFSRFASSGRGLVVSFWSCFNILMLGPTYRL